MSKVIDASKMFKANSILKKEKDFDFAEISALQMVIEQNFMGSFADYCIDFHHDKLNELVSFYHIENPCDQDLVHMGTIYNNFLKFAKKRFKCNMATEIQAKMSEMNREQQQLDRILQIFEIEKSQKAEVIKLDAQKEIKESKEKGK